MYYNEVISILKQGPTSLKARRTCWEDDSHIIYNKYTDTVTYTRRQKFEDGAIASCCYTFISSHSDITRDDWEIFE